MSTKFKHPITTELAANSGAAVRTMRSVLEIAELTGTDYAAVLWPSDPSRAAFVYGAMPPDGLYVHDDLPDIRGLLGAGRATLHQLIQRDAAAAGVMVELEDWRARAVAAETEVARLLILVRQPDLSDAAGDPS